MDYFFLLNEICQNCNRDFTIEELENREMRNEYQYLY